MSTLPTLDQFIQDYGFPNSFVKCAGFASLYVRKGARYINGKRVEGVLDLASARARHPGHGAFTLLIRRLQHSYPHLTLYAESVLNPRMHAKLLSLGFERVEGAYDNYVLWPTKEITHGHRRDQRREGGGQGVGTTPRSRIKRP